MSKLVVIGHVPEHIKKETAKRFAVNSTEQPVLPRSSSEAAQFANKYFMSDEDIYFLVNVEYVYPPIIWWIDVLAFYNHNHANYRGVFSLMAYYQTTDEVEFSI